jgi:membrane-bound lytic murein transglycosylase D
MKRTLSLAFPLVLAGCLRPAASVVQPTPAPAGQVTGRSGAAGDSLNAAPSSTANVAVQQAAPANASPMNASSESSSVNKNDVARRAAEVFGDTCADGSPAPTSADATTDSAEPSWDIDVRSYESMDRVEHYVRLFSTTAREHIEQRLSRGTRYEPMIREKMRAGGLPEDMYYLALVESGFDPNAYSRAAAVGMWQFMTSTARDMGLRVDWWVDERRDPFRSTDAAVGFIKGLRDQFGSLYLAAAAYNGGPGRIARGLSRYADDLEGTSGDDLFFALAEKDYLRNETREYVPQLIAAALIGKEPARYGMNLTIEPPVTYDSARVGPGTALAAVATAADTTLDAIRELNPEILRGVTPPKDSFYVRIPTGGVAHFDSAFAELPKSARLGLVSVTSKKGQRLETIAEAQGISVRKLAAFNPRLRKLKSGRLVAGQTVLVPTEAALDGATDVPDPAIERYGSTASTTTHVVKSGETISGIAKKYHTTTAVIMRANGLKKALIFPGQSLIVKGSAAHVASSATKHTTAKKSSAKTASKKSTKKAAPVKKSSSESASRSVSKPASKASSKSSAKKTSNAKTSTKATAKSASKTKRP